MLLDYKAIVFLLLYSTILLIYRDAVLTGKPIVIGLTYVTINATIRLGHSWHPCNIFFTIVFAINIVKLWLNYETALTAHHRFIECLGFIELYCFEKLYKESLSGGSVLLRTCLSRIYLSPCPLIFPSFLSAMTWKSPLLSDPLFWCLVPCGPVTTP